MKKTTTITTAPDEYIIYKLKKPIVFENATYTELKLRESEVGDYSGLTKIEDDILRQIKLISNISGVPTGAVKKIKYSDLLEINKILEVVELKKKN